MLYSNMIVPRVKQEAPCERVIFDGEVPMKIKVNSEPKAIKTRVKIVSNIHNNDYLLHRIYFCDFDGKLNDCQKDILSLLTRKINILSYLATGCPFNYEHITSDQPNWVNKTNRSLYEGDDLLKKRLNKWLPVVDDALVANSDSEDIYNLILAEYVRNEALTYIAYYWHFEKKALSSLEKKANKCYLYRIDGANEKCFESIIMALSCLRNCLSHPRGMLGKEVGICPIFSEHSKESIASHITNHTSPLCPYNHTRNSEQPICRDIIYKSAMSNLLHKDRISPGAVAIAYIKTILRFHILHFHFELWENDDTGLKEDFNRYLFEDIRPRIYTQEATKGTESNEGTAQN